MQHKLNNKRYTNANLKITKHCKYYKNICTQQTSWSVVPELNAAVTCVCQLKPSFQAAAFFLHFGVICFSWLWNAKCFFLIIWQPQRDSRSPTIGPDLASIRPLVCGWILQTLPNCEGDKGSFEGWLLTTTWKEGKYHQILLKLKENKCVEYIDWEREERSFCHNWIPPLPCFFYPDPLLVSMDIDWLCFPDSGEQSSLTGVWDLL